MDAKDAIRHMIQASGKSGRDVSREMGRSPSYISAQLARGGYDVTASTLARVAAACGYSVQIVGHGESVELEAMAQISDGPEA